MAPKVHVTTEPSWICRRLADHLKSLDGFRVRVTTDAPRDASLTYYLPYLFREFYRPVGKSVALFTHYESGSHKKRYDSIAGQVDHCIVLNNGHYQYLGQRVGFENVTRVHLPVKRDEKLPRLKVGWFHRSPDGYGHRKRLDLLNSVKALDWVELVTSDGKLSQDQLYERMRYVDVFLTTSDYESGPVSLLEAMSLGKMAVLPFGVGLADEFVEVPGVYRFHAGDADSLRRALETAYRPLKLRYASISRNTVQRWREDHINVFRKVLDG